MLHVIGCSEIPELLMKNLKKEGELSLIHVCAKLTFALYTVEVDSRFRVMWAKLLT